jgi:hypothetical protein
MPAPVEIGSLRCLLGSAVLALMVSQPVMAAESSPDGSVQQGELSGYRFYSPYAYRDFPDRLLFGDMHLHTNLSPDAGLLKADWNYPL